MPAPRRERKRRSGFLFRRAHKAPPKKDDLILAVFGATGAGKSTFIEHATNLEDGSLGSDSLASCTKPVVAYSYPHPRHHGTNVVLIDTPGFNDTSLSDSDVLAGIASFLNESYKEGQKLTGMLFFHRISDNRIGNTPLNNLNMFREICGNNALENAVMVTTMWDLIEPRAGAKREAQLQDEFWRPFTMRGSKYSRFNRTHESAWDIVDLLPGVAKALKIQEEMVDEGIPLSETSAGRTLSGWLNDQLLRFKYFFRWLENAMRTSGSAPVELEAQRNERKATLAAIQETEQQEMALAANTALGFNLTHSPLNTSPLSSSPTDELSPLLACPESQRTLGNAGASDRLRVALSALAHTRHSCTGWGIQDLILVLWMSASIFGNLEIQGEIDSESAALAEKIHHLVKLIGGNLQNGQVDDAMKDAATKLVRAIKDALNTLSTSATPHSAPKRHQSNESIRRQVVDCERRLGYAQDEYLNAVNISAQRIIHQKQQMMKGSFVSVFRK